MQGLHICHGVYFGGQRLIAFPGSEFLVCEDLPEFPKVGSKFSRSLTIFDHQCLFHDISVQNRVKSWALLLLLLLNHLLYWCTCTHTIIYGMPVELGGNLQESVSPSTMWVLEIEFRLGGECLYPWSHLTGPTFFSPLVLRSNQEHIHIGRKCFTTEKPLQLSAFFYFLKTSILFLLLCC